MLYVFHQVVISKCRDGCICQEIVTSYFMLGGIKVIQKYNFIAGILYELTILNAAPLLNLLYRFTY